MTKYTHAKRVRLSSAEQPSKIDVHENFLVTFEKFLHNIVKKFALKPLTKETLVEIRQTMFDKTVESFKRSQYHFSDDTIKFIIDEYFSHIVINGQELRVMLVMHDPDPNTVPESEVHDLKKLFEGTSVGEKLALCRSHT